jgi:hypothetical protein
MLSLMALPPAVYFAARVHESSPVAFRAAGLSAVLAAPLLFFPDVDLITPALAAIAVGAWLRSERRRRAWWTVVSGGCIALLAACSFGNLALVAPFALQAVLSWRRRPVGIAFEARRALGLLAPILGLWIAAGAGGHDFTAALREGLRQHHRIVAFRPYGLWLLITPLEFFALSGVATAAWLLRATPWHQQLAAARRLRMDPVSALWAAVLVALVLLNLSGSTKGEVGRLWMGYLPMLIVGGAAVWRERGRAEWAVVTGLSLLALSVLKGFYAFVWVYS